MEELLSSDGDIDIETSSHCDLYKYSNRTIEYSQEKKRDFFLQKQKEKRSTAIDEKRNLSQLFENEDDPPEQMECETFYKNKNYARKFPFGYKMMDSEWFTEVPEDLTENWLMKLCLQGIRQLVVANKAATTCYYRNGKVASKFKSKLPGGNTESARKFTVLDCVFNKSANTLFIYDVLAWNSMSLLNAEAHMRFCWLKSKFDENPDMLEINPDKNFNFIVMDTLMPDTVTLQDHMSNPYFINNCEVSYDGVLFYHREGHYVFKSSPLVGWLKSFMLAEIFNVDVNPTHLSNKPKDYECVQQYLSAKATKKKREKKENEDMEGGNDMECDNS